MPAAFIQDGYTLTGTIQPTKDRVGLKFTYRRCTGAVRRRYLNSPLGSEEQTAGDLFLDHVQARTVTVLELQPDGKITPADPMVLTSAQFNKLDPDLWIGVLNRILGYETPDPATTEGN